MVAHIVLGAARLGDSLLQVFILYCLHAELMVLFGQGERFVLFKNQLGYDVIDENGVIEKVFEKAKPDTNAQEILDYLDGKAE